MAEAMAPGPAVSPAALGAGEGKPLKPPTPTEFPPPVKATIDWLQRSFSGWYAAHPPPLPDRFTRREFGFIPWPDKPGPPPFFRHKSYETSEKFHNYLAWAGPHSAYYSTAYYRRPGEMKMVDKGWLGAELIFDLDADHLVEAEKAKAAGKEMPLAEQLALVKTQFKRLLDEFLFGDFGLSEKDVWITFSGGRGYHAHVVEPRLLNLDSRARREVVDYVTGKFPMNKEGEQDFSPHVRKKGTASKGRGEFAKGVYSIEVATADSPGWGGRLTRKVVEILDTHVLDVEKPAAVKWLKGLPGIGATKAEKFATKYTPAVRARLMGEARTTANSLTWTAGRDPTGHVLLSGEHNALEQVYAVAQAEFGLPDAKGETDEPVTADVKRLIRLPGSLHGKSGLKVVTLTRSQLDAFEPLRDAAAFTMDPIPIVPRFDQEATLGGERVAVKKGERVDVPEQHAVFWCARQAATVAFKAPEKK